MKRTKKDHLSDKSFARNPKIGGIQMNENKIL